MSKEALIHTTAKIGEKCKIWYWTQICANVVIGDNTIIGSNCFIGENVQIGKNCKIQGGCFIPSGVIIYDNVFIGPNVTFTNDKYPSSVNIDDSLKTSSDWTILNTLIERNVSIGAGAVILPGITIHTEARIGAGAVVTKDIQSYSTVVGNPARDIVGRKNEDSMDR